MTKKEMTSVGDYLLLPYTMVVRRDEDGNFVARVVELRGCISHGDTPEEALSGLREVQTAWIEDAIERGDRVPMPEEAELTGFSGRWVQRVPRDLHRRLANLAEREATSLNQLVSTMLAECIAARESSAAVSDIAAELYRVTLRGALHDLSTAGGWVPAENWIFSLPGGRSRIKAAAAGRRLFATTTAVEALKESLKGGAWLESDDEHAVEA